MRTLADRIRHAVLFELVGLAIFTPAAALALGRPMHETGLLGVACSLIATGWNGVFNWLFDKAMVRLTGSSLKAPRARVLHAILFELGLLVVLVPFIAWQLGMTLEAAFLMDLGVAIFYMVYGFAFNWAYDVIFPIPGEGKAKAKAAEGGEGEPNAPAR